MRKYIKALTGISEKEWIKLSFLINKYFQNKHRELERELQLPEDIELDI